LRGDYHSCQWWHTGGYQSFILGVTNKLPMHKPPMLMGGIPLMGHQPSTAGLLQLPNRLVGSITGPGRPRLSKWAFQPCDCCAQLLSLDSTDPAAQGQACTCAVALACAGNGRWLTWRVQCNQAGIIWQQAQHAPHGILPHGFKTMMPHALHNWQQVDELQV
jgi:hypothetical protein